MTIPMRKPLTSDRTMLELAAMIDSQLLRLHDLINKFQMSDHPNADECAKALRRLLIYPYAVRVAKDYIAHPNRWEEWPGVDGAVRQKICIK